MSACSKIRNIVRLRQMLQRWRKMAVTAARRRVSTDVPSGHMAVIVGASCKRFVVRATYLNHPIFKKLLSQAEEEFGFTNSGLLAIPCDESLFEELLRYLARFDSVNNNMSRFMNFEDFQRYCYMDIRSNLDFWGDSRPLLH
ncbi:PREDICTED: indole-3-acetic acid-induced protein ARG7-like [Nicotiana attenuata]|uniref:Auxin-responsive protein saur40 n=1 Tax=Nicotiana attenuata TaxID=49451 RepID=A0A314KYU8_NICAT|nr:PREDICTED: indole-3-acetic acid-induced protein ARG7-like [Nicotiana attenuata]OIT33909.1 auxin-responsive protein saur40 [Nicotiana attenuata]